MAVIASAGMGDLEHARFDVGELSLHAVSAGPATGPVVVLLHGFPEFWYSWRRQIPALVAAGFRVVAPDLRGYNLSDRPLGVSNYRLEKLAADIAGLIAAVSPGKKVRLVGHDWGGGIAWAMGHWHPELIDRLVVLNAPHPAILKPALLSPSMAARVWHFFFFQLPYLPERAILGRDFLHHALRGLSRKKEAAFSDAEIAEYAVALHKPGAATAMLNYYRAMKAAVGLELTGKIAADTLLIWGDKDKALPPFLTEGTDRQVAGKLRIEHLAEASHWVHHDEPDKVNELLIEFFK